MLWLIVELCFAEVAAQKSAKTQARPTIEGPRRYAVDRFRANAQYPQEVSWSEYTRCLVKIQGGGCPYATGTCFVVSGNV